MHMLKFPTAIMHHIHQNAYVKYLSLCKSYVPDMHRYRPQRNVGAGADVVGDDAMDTLHICCTCGDVPQRKQVKVQCLSLWLTQRVGLLGGRVQLAIDELVKRRAKRSRLHHLLHAFGEQCTLVC